MSGERNLVSCTAYDEAILIFYSSSRMSESERKKLSPESRMADIIDLARVIRELGTEKKILEKRLQEVKFKGRARQL